MRTLIRATLVILGLQGGTALAGLQAQAAPAQDKSANRACALLTDKEIDAATGLDYDAAEPVDDPGPSGTASCLWGGASFAPGAARPQLGVMLTQMLPSAVNAPFPAAPPPAGCTRETLGGVGDKAYLELCERSRGLKANVKVGRNRIMLQLDPEHGKPLASAKPALVALAKAVALGDAGNAQARTPAAGASACLPASEISLAVGFEVVLLDRASQVVGPRRICGYQSTDGADQTFVSTIVLPASDGEQAIQDVRAAAKTMSGAEAEAVDLGDGGVAYTSSGKSEAVVSHGDRVYRVDLTTAGLGNRGDKDAALAVVRKLMR